MLTILLLTFALGCVTGLRSFTGPAVVSWAAHFGWLHFAATKLAFIDRGSVLAAFTLLGVIELIVDKLPKTPPRTAPLGLGARIVLGGACGVALAVSAQVGVALPALVASVGAGLAAFAGYNIRRNLVSRVHLPDFAVAVAEDLIAVGGGLLIVSHF